MLGAGLVALAAATAVGTGLSASPWLALAGGALILGLLCLPAVAESIENRGVERNFLLALPFLALLAAKDLLPTFPLSGAAERRAALAAADLAWPATARNPALGPGAAQLAALLLAVAFTAVLASRVAGSTRRALVALNVPAWVLAAFGLAVYLKTQHGLPYGPGNGVGVIASKNGAGTLLAIGLLLHAGLGLHAYRAGTINATALHLLAAAALVPPLAQVGSWTALLALAAGTAVYFWLSIEQPKATWRDALLPLTLALVPILLLATLDVRLAERLGGLGRDFRWQIWRDTLPLALSYPGFGVGLGAFEEVYPLFGALELPCDARLLHPDSSWIKLLHEWGAGPLAAALLVGGVRGWRRLARFRFASPAESVALPGRTAAAAAAAWLASGLTDVTLHRPESLLLGATLLGVAAAATGGRAGGWRRREEVLGAVVVLAVAGGLIAWSAGPGRRELRWGLLDPSRLWVAAAAPDATPPTPAQLARFQAAVALQHRSASFPLATARFLHPRDPAAAFDYWCTAIRRAGNTGADYFARALVEFPATPPEYWRRLADHTNPDFVLGIHTLPPADYAEAVAAWIERAGPPPVSAASAQLLLDAVTRLARPDLLAAAVDRLPIADPKFWAGAARVLRAAGRAAPAWRAAAHLLPAPVETVASPAAASVLGPDALLQLGKFTELRAHLLAPASAAVGSTPRRLLLEKICAAPGAPAWFHLQLAAALAESGDYAAAVDRLLHADSLAHPYPR